MKKIAENRGIPAPMILAISIFFLIGCKPPLSIPDNSKINVVPGYGVSNLCILGMNQNQIEQALPDATMRTTDHRVLSWRALLKRDGSILMPSLGATVAVGFGKTISAINFHVDPYRAAMVPGLEVKTPFRGTLDNKLSFSGPVTQKEVEEVFGATQRTITNWTDSTTLISAAIPFRQKRLNGDEVLSYPTNGVSFVLRSNAVTSFQIFSPAKAPTTSSSAVTAAPENLPP